MVVVCNTEYLSNFKKQNKVLKTKKLKKNGKRTKTNNS